MTASMAGIEVPTIHEALRDVIDAIGGVGRDGFNSNQNFSFRSIEGVVNATRPALIANGIDYTPSYVSLEQTDFTREDGRVVHRSILSGNFLFTGPRGDSIVVTTIGEATDLEGRASNKAQSAALKYALMQLLQIGSGEDGDHADNAPAHSAPPQQQRQVRQAAPQSQDVASRITQRAAQGHQAPTSDSLSKGQSGNLYRLWNHVLHWDRNRYLQEIELIIGRAVTDDRQLTKQEASEVISSLKDTAGESDDQGVSRGQRPIPNEPPPEYADQGQYGYSEAPFSEEF